MAFEAWHALNELDSPVHDVLRMALLMEHVVEHALGDRKPLKDGYIPIREEDADAVEFAAYLLRDLVKTFNDKYEAARNAARPKV